MKYIRTKDGRILRVPFTKQEYDTSFPNTAVSYDEWFGLWKYDMQILNQADTIEELCDEFVGISDGEPQMLRFVPYACAQYWNGGVYGAIWTDNGLIYVAKMNDKGELELL